MSRQRSLTIKASKMLVEKSTLKILFIFDKIQEVRSLRMQG